MVCWQIQNTESGTREQMLGKTELLVFDGDVGYKTHCGPGEEPAPASVLRETAL